MVEYIMLGNIYMTTEDVIKNYKLQLVETKGDIKFYKHPVSGKEYQLVNGEFIKVKDGNITYKYLKQVNGFTIKYNTNGLYGFTIFNGNTPLEDGIWSFKQAIEIACEM